MKVAPSKSPNLGRLLVAALALAGSAAWAHEPATAPATPEPAPAAVEAAPTPDVEATAAPETAPELSGMVVSIGTDGKLRPPTRQEAMALLAQRMPAIARMSSTRVERLPSGLTRAILGPEHLSFSMVSVGADGQLQDVCTDDPVSVLQILDGGVQEEK